MYLNLTSKDLKKRQSSSTSAHRARPIDNQIRFYEDRLPEGGSRHLLHLSLHVQSALSDEILDQTQLPIGQILNGAHRFINSRHQHLKSLALSGEGLDQWNGLKSILAAPAKGLHSLRIAGNAGRHLTVNIVHVFPQLRAVDVLIDDRSAEYEIQWPYESMTRSSPLSETASISIISPEITSTPSQIERLVMQRSLAVGDESQAAARPRSFDFCQHLEIGAAPFSFFFDPSPMKHLRTIILHNALFNPSFTLPNAVNPFDATEPTTIERFLQVPLDFPFLETFKMIYADTNEPGARGNIPRYKLRPTLYLSRLKAPKLRHLTIRNFGPVTPTSPYLHASEQNAWRAFCENHPLLEEVILFKTTVTDLAESLPLLRNVEKLLLSYADLNPQFLKSATSPTLPNLKKLSVSHCSNITSGDLLRLVQSKKTSQFDYLDISNCTDLQREAVDWLKGNVKEVTWSGWGGKNERRPFTFRA